jgi:polyhydroxyalkanoate synthesis regulator protein
MVKSEHRVTIKRYANRRFYDAGTASYVTAADIAATGEDITDFILAKNRFH